MASTELALHHDLRHAIDHAAHLLPAQGPITVFIHHNTLHAFEEHSFEKAVVEGATAFGCQPFMTEERFRAELGRGRIRVEDLRTVLADDLGPRANESIAGLATRERIRMGLLQNPIWTGPTAELDWYINEADALRRMRGDVAAPVRAALIAETRRWAMRDLRVLAERGSGPKWLAELFTTFRLSDIETWDASTWEGFTVEALWHICQAGFAGVPAVAPRSKLGVRHRDLLLAVTSIDVDTEVNALLIRVCAAFLDQGVAHWPLPNRERGLFQAFLSLYRRANGPPDRWLAALSTEAARLQDAGTSALDSIAESLHLFGVSPGERDAYLGATFLALRGWGGMIQQMEQRGDRIAYPPPQGSLDEFLAVRLLLDRIAAQQLAANALDFDGSLAELRDALRYRLDAVAPRTIVQRTFPLFQFAQIIGWTPEALERLTPDQWTELIAEIEGFTSIERRRVFHLAYERRFRTQSLDAVALHRPQSPKVDRPRFQIVTCLDEREESFRRHIEEVAPDAETFGAAGFFGIAIYFRGAADAHFVPLCPIVLTPGHWVEEQVVGEQASVHRQRAKTRKVLGGAALRFHAGTRSAGVGAVLTAGFGVLASVPLVARVLFPRLAGRVRDWFGRYVQTPPLTRLQLERTGSERGPDPEKQGYALAEMATTAGRLLRDIGMTERFARVVLVVGHGSNSMNNPHKSAYDCGACGGSPGAPNGRALAQMLNDPRIRERLAADGIRIPDDTWFMGGLHNTCDDSVTLAELDRVPETHRAEVAQIQIDLGHALDRNAHERSRRFMSAPLNQTIAEARLHVIGRSEDLAQTRPELGHATNALCIVARRERTRGLYLDRRAFLVSYDPKQDDDAGFTLTRLLSAAVPVCGGINLEYYFSHVDSQGYGCGTKLPHNITSLIGVMDGAASDLRTGLPWQMVEIHEPVRLLFIVESNAATMTSIMDQNPGIGGMIRNGWVQLSLLDPDSDRISVYRDGAFGPYEPMTDHLPVAASSLDWYRGCRDHLEFAEIGR